jgi:hypothetical protein
MKKEIWEIPCNHIGFLTVYFQEGKVTSNANNSIRTYKFDTNGVCMSDYSKNDGFAQDLNQTMIIKMVCDSGTVVIPYYSNNNISDTISSHFYATNMIVGKKDHKPYASIFIVKNESKTGNVSK